MNPSNNSMNTFPLSPAVNELLQHHSRGAGDNIHFSQHPDHGMSPPAQASNMEATQFRLVTVNEFLGHPSQYFKDYRDPCGAVQPNQHGAHQATANASGFQNQQPFSIQPYSGGMGPPPPVQNSGFQNQQPFSIQPYSGGMGSPAPVQSTGFQNQQPFSIQPYSGGMGPPAPIQNTAAMHHQQPLLLQPYRGVPPPPIQNIGFQAQHPLTLEPYRGGMMPQAPIQNMALQHQQPLLMQPYRGVPPAQIQNIGFQAQHPLSLQPYRGGMSPQAPIQSTGFQNQQPFSIQPYIGSMTPPAQIQYNAIQNQQQLSIPGYSGGMIQPAEQTTGALIQPSSHTPRYANWGVPPANKDVNRFLEHPSAYFPDCIDQYGMSTPAPSSVTCEMSNEEPSAVTKTSPEHPSVHFPDYIDSCGTSSAAPANARLRVISNEELGIATKMSPEHPSVRFSDFIDSCGTSSAEPASVSFSMMSNEEPGTVTKSIMKLPSERFGHTRNPDEITDGSKKSTRKLKGILKRPSERFQHTQTPDETTESSQPSTSTLKGNSNRNRRRSVFKRRQNKKNAIKKRKHEKEILKNWTPSDLMQSSKKPKTNANWHYVHVLNAAHLKRKELFKILGEHCRQPEFTPFWVRKRQNEISFLTDDKEVAKQLFKADIPQAGGINISTYSTPFKMNYGFHINQYLRSILLIVVGNRLSAESQCVNLSKFHYDSFLTDRNLFAPITERPVLACIMEIIREQTNTLLNVDLSENHLSNIDALKFILTKFPGLRSVNLSNNKILSFEEVMLLQNMPIENIFLQGNGCIEKFKTPEQYKSTVKLILPRLLFLDGYDVSSFSISENVKAAVEQLTCIETAIINRQGLSISETAEYYNKFLRHYFKLYDSDPRGKGLQDFYCDSAFLTYNICMGALTFSPKSAITVSKYLKKLKHITKHGNTDIANFLMGLPKTHHDVDDCKLNVILTQDGTIQLSIWGKFSEEPNVRGLLYFERTYILKHENGGPIILNDYYRVIIPNEIQTESFQKKEELPEERKEYNLSQHFETALNFNETLDDKTIIRFSEMCGLDEHYSMTILSQHGGDFDAALNYVKYFKALVPNSVFLKKAEN